MFWRNTKQQELALAIATLTARVEVLERPVPVVIIFSVTAAGLPAGTHPAHARSAGVARAPQRDRTRFVKFFNTGKGYAFIEKEGGGEIFVHISAVTEGVELLPGQRVQFVERPSRKNDGRLEARDVLIV
jgi:cold shock protein